MKKIRKNGHKLLLSSLAALLVFSSVNFNEVFASEEENSGDNGLEQDVSEFVEFDTIDSLEKNVEETFENDNTEVDDKTENVEYELNHNQDSDELFEQAEDELIDFNEDESSEETFEEFDTESVLNEDDEVELQFETMNVTSRTTNHIEIIEDGTENIITSTTISGSDYSSGLYEYIESFNNQNGTDIELVSHAITSTRVSETSINNRVNRHVENQVTAFVINNSDSDISNLKPPFLPPSTIYDDTDRSRYYRTVEIVYNGRELHSETYITYLTLDQSVRNAMESINSDLYYYESIDVSQGFLWTVYPGGVYQGPSQDVTVYVNQYDPVLENISEEIEEIPFETIYNENNHVPIGEERVVQEGVNGSITTITTTRTHYGEQVGEPIVEVITVDPVSEIIDIGTGVVEQETNIYEEAVPFEVEYVNNSELLVGEEETTQEGVNGLQTVTEQITTVGGLETDRERISEDVTLAPVNQIVQVGTKAIFNETRTEDVEFDTEYVDNAELLIGEEEISQIGLVGIRTIVEEVTTIEDEETDRVLLSSEITEDPVIQIVQVGTKDIFEETRTEEIPFEVVYEDNPELEVGTEEIFQEGVNGVRTIVESVTTVGGEETNREVVSDEVTTEPINQVVQVGVTSITEETRTEEIPFEVVYEDNPELPVGTEEVSQEGANGVRTIVESVTTVGGVETDREVVSEKITTEPVHQVVQVGTQVADTEDGETPVAPGDGASTGSDEDGGGVVPAPPADSGVSESDDSTQQEMLPETGTALTNAFASLAGLLLAMGASFIFFTRRRNAVK